MKKLPWNESALPTIKYFRLSPEISRGFELVKKIEDEENRIRRQGFQLAHLLEIAQHEQGIILQPLIYDDPAFAGWVKRQRAPYAKWASPDLEIVFTHQCKNKFDKVKSRAPDDTKLENLLSRMNWIKAAANKFHGLMINQPSFMKSALTNIAGWVDMPDT